LLGGLAFLVIAFHLWRRRTAVWFIMLPMVFMLIMPAWAMTLQIFIGTADTPSWLARGEWVLVFVGVATMALEAWMIVEAVLLLPKVRGVIEANSLDGEHRSAIGAGN
jgi:carbon starvation protein